MAPTRVQAKAIAWSELLAILPEEIRSKTNETELYVRFPNGAIIEIKGADHEEGLLGPGLNAFGIDEAQDLKPHVFTQILLPMLLGKNGKTMLIGTKRTGNWFRELWKKSHTNQFPDSECFFFPSFLNPTISQDEWDKEKKLHTDWEWQREFVSDPLTKDGEEVGLKYPEFEFNTHVIEPFEFDASYTHFRSIDWGLDHPTVCGFAALNNTNKNVYFYDEHKANNLSVEIHAKAIIGKSKYPIQDTVLDPSCWRREAVTMKSVAQEFMKNDIRCVPGEKETQDKIGANTVKLFLKNSNDASHVFFFKNCINIIQKLSIIKWEDKTGDDEEDMVRYMLCHLSKLTGIVQEVAQKITGKFASGNDIYEMKNGNMVNFQHRKIQRENRESVVQWDTTGYLS